MKRGSPSDTIPPSALPSALVGRRGRAGRRNSRCCGGTAPRPPGGSRDRVTAAASSWSCSARSRGVVPAFITNVSSPAPKPNATLLPARIDCSSSVVCLPSPPTGSDGSHRRGERVLAGVEHLPAVDRSAATWTRSRLQVGLLEVEPEAVGEAERADAEQRLGGVARRPCPARRNRCSRTRRPRLRPRRASSAAMPSFHAARSASAPPSGAVRPSKRISGSVERDQLLLERLEHARRRDLPASARGTARGCFPAWSAPGRPAAA